jgi:hypothetical protein
MPPSKKGLVIAKVDATAPTNAIVKVEEVKKEKKIKKAVKVVAVVTPDGIEGNFIAEPRRPLIAHLLIKTSDVNFHDQAIHYDPNPPVQPEPYDAGADDFFTVAQENIQLEVAVTVPTNTFKDEKLYKAAATVEENRPLQCFVRADLMVEFKDMRKEKKLPESTETACFWCCHGFEGMPCVIPEREVHGIYNVYGNFCSPECGVAYLLSENLDPHVRWERMALLHRIYDNQAKGRIFPAAARECLRLFGGPLTIESFRSTVRSGRVRIDVHMPPMVSILGSIDTKPIDFFDSSLKNTVAGGAFQAEKVQKAEEGLRLKRSKPLKDKESTLDTVMNIQIGGKKKKV